MEIDSHQVINLVNSSDEEEATSALNPPIPSNAFLPASSASTSRPKPKRTNAVVILSDSDNESDIECLTPKEKRPKIHEIFEDPIEDQPCPSGLNSR